MPRWFGAKTLWYLLLSVAGVFTAEVMSWSSPNVLINPLNFVLTFPVYAIHYVVLWNVAWLLGRRDWRMLYVLGCFTGLYETWITKVFWSPPWPSAVGWLGVHWVEVLWIGFTWHAFMSFLVPIRLCETFVGPRSASRHVPAWRFAMLALVPFVGAVVGTASGVPLESMFASVAGSAIVIGLVAFLFTRAARREGIATLESLRLTPRGLVQWTMIAVGLYAAYFAILRPDAVPGPIPIAITTLFEVLLLLLALALARVAGRPSEEVPGSVRFRLSSYSLYVLYALFAFGGIVILGAIAPGLMAVLFAGGIIVGVGLPIVLLGSIVYRVRRAWPSLPAASQPAAG